MVCEVRGSQQGSIDQLYRQPSPGTPDPFTTPGAARARSTPAPRPRPRPGTRRGATRREWRGRRRWKPTRWWGWWRRWRRRGTSWPWPWAWPRHPPRRARMNQDDLRRQMDLLAEDARQRSVGRRIAGITHTNTVTTVYVCPPPTRYKRFLTPSHRSWSDADGEDDDDDDNEGGLFPHKGGPRDESGKEEERCYSFSSLLPSPAPKPLPRTRNVHDRRVVADRGRR